MSEAAESFTKVMAGWQLNRCHLKPASGLSSYPTIKAQFTKLTPSGLTPANKRQWERFKRRYRPTTSQ
jgi:hypothetical protein